MRTHDHGREILAGFGIELDGLRVREVDIKFRPGFDPEVTVTRTLKRDDYDSTGVELWHTAKSRYRIVRSDSPEGRVAELEQALGCAISLLGDGRANDAIQALDAVTRPREPLEMLTDEQRADIARGRPMGET